jgi:hypothetical protein
VAALDWRVQATDYIAVFDEVAGLPARQLFVLPVAEESLRGTSRFVARPDLRHDDRRATTRALIPAQRSATHYDDRRAAERRQALVVSLVEEPTGGVTPSLVEV